MNLSDQLRKHSERLAVDSTATQFQARAEHEWPAVSARWSTRTLDALLAACPPPATPLEPAAAGEYFTLLRQTLEEDLRRLAQSYPTVQWLWYLRRLPDLFDDVLSTTGPYDRSLMETVAATSTKPSPALPRSQGQISFPVTDGVVRRVLRLASTTIVLSDLHSRLRRAGKGMAFELQPGHPLPVNVPTPHLEQAIALYDQRVAALGGGLLGAGTQVLSRDHYEDDPLPVIAVSSLSWQGLPSWTGPLVDGTPVVAWGRFVPDLLSVGQLRRLLALSNQHPAWWQPQLPALVALLQALSHYLIHYTSHGWLSLTRYGYVTMGRDLLTSYLDHVLPMLRSELDTWFPDHQLTGPDTVLATLDTLTVTAWPLTAPPVLHHAGPDIIVDLDAATRHLLTLCTIAPERQGPLVNIRADHFEETVQKLINDSPWKPSPHAPRRGLEPRPHGRNPLTDFDAVGENGDTLLLVSCKSRPYTGLYDAGDYATVRNSVTLIEQAVARWQQVTCTLTEQPQGANYDLSRYRHILGVVCLPHTPYTPLGAATQIIDTRPDRQTLRMACSYNELAAWLDATG